MRRWLLCSAALLSACAEAPAPEVRLVRPTAPEALLDCPAAPAPPGGGATQRDAALFIIDLHAAHGACRDRLHAVGALIRAAPRTARRGDPAP